MTDVRLDDECKSCPRKGDLEECSRFDCYLHKWWLLDAIFGKIGEAIMASITARKGGYKASTAINILESNLPKRPLQ